MKDLYIAGERGNVYRFREKDQSLSICNINGLVSKEVLMGLARQNEYLFVGGKSKIYKVIDNKVIKISKAYMKPRPDFHQIHIYDDMLYATASATNEIFVFDLDLVLIKKYTIQPPNVGKVRQKINYNHINNIYKHKDQYYVCLNWFTAKQYASSGVAILDKDFKELKRLEYGWQSHGFILVDDVYYALCASSGDINKINHVNKAGLLVNGKLVFEHDPKYFCKGFVLDEDYIYIVGGSIARRDNRANADGILYILNREFDLINNYVWRRTGGFCGVIQ